MEDKAQDLYVCIKGKGKPLAMVHGIISDSTFFEDAMNILADDHQVIAYDRRGYGRSIRRTYSDYSVRVQADDLAGILKSNCREPAWIVGNSAGGLIAVEAAIRYPGMVRGMILVEPSLGYEDAEREKLIQWNEELNGYVKAGRIKNALPAFSRVTGAAETKKNAASFKELKQTYQNLSAFMYGELNEVQRYLPPVGELRKISVPVIVAVTEKGRESIFATSSETGARIIGWPVVTLPGYHNTAKDMPDEFAEKVKEIIAEYG